MRTKLTLAISFVAVLSFRCWNDSAKPQMTAPVGMNIRSCLIQLKSYEGLKMFNQLGSQGRELGSRASRGCFAVGLFQAASEMNYERVS